ncbi:hypothetical protein Tco_1279997 [Tanacetum coccineum]
MEGLACSCPIALNRLYIALRVLVENCRRMSTPVFDPYEAIRQAYLVGTDTESKPIEDLMTESPESPHVIASPISFPDSTLPVGHVEESEGSDTSGAGSTSSDSTTPLLPDHSLTHDTPVLVPSLSEVAAMSDVAFHKRFRSPNESSPSPSPTLTVWKRYRGTSELVLSTDSEADELRDKEDSLDSNSESEGAEDEGPATGDDDPGMRDEGFGLGEDEDVPKGQQRASPVVETAVGEPLGLGYGALRRRELANEEDQKYNTFEVDPEDGTIYINVPTYPPPAPPVQTPPSPDWTPGSLPISPPHSDVPAPISSPLISLTVSLHVATPTATIPKLTEEPFIRLYTYIAEVSDEIFSQRYRLRSLEQEQERAVITFRALWRPVLALEAWAGHVDTRMASMSRAGYDDHRLVHDLLVQQAALQCEV